MSQIKTHKGYYVNRLGKVFSTNTRNGKTICMKTTVSNCGYEMVIIGGRKNAKNALVHRLVANAFIPNPTKKPEVNHIDGNKLNNNMDSLEWVTKSENMKHAIEHNLIDFVRGEDSSSAKITNQEAIDIINLFIIGKSNDFIANKYGLHSRYVSLIRHKKRWKHIWDEHFKDVKPVKSFTDKYSHLDRDAIVKDALTTTMTNIELEEKYSVDRSTISRIRTGSRVPKVWMEYIDKYSKLNIEASNDYRKHI